MARGRPASKEELERIARWQKENRDRVRQYKKKYRDTHKKERAEYAKKRGQKAHIKARANDIHQKRIKEDITYKCRRLWHSARSNSKARGHEFNAPVELWTQFGPMACEYCNEPPLLAHGLDRKDPRRPYEADNVVPCCVPCNTKKGTMQYEEFIEYLKRQNNK